jgi:creatinine amidohydrolase
MKLAEMTTVEVDQLSRDVVVVIPTGSLEQHGPHLPLFTDSILATAVSEAVERAVPDKVLLLPTIWMGASAHHQAFAGTVSASMAGYIAAVQGAVRAMTRHHFTKFFLVNGHGGNVDPNGVALREIKAENPDLTVGASNYYTFCEAEGEKLLRGPLKRIRHACEAETSLMLHVAPHLVRLDKAQDGGLVTSPETSGLILHFDEQTDVGSYGYPSYGTAQVGEALFNAAVTGLVRNLSAIYEGFVLISRDEG